MLIMQESSVLDHAHNAGIQCIGLLRSLLAIDLRSLKINNDNLNCMIQKNAVHGLTDPFHASK